MLETTTDQANDNVKVIAMIETREGIENVDAILDVEGLDGAFVGPSDLSISLGFPPKGNPTEPTVLKAIAQVCLIYIDNCAIK